MTDKPGTPRRVRVSCGTRKASGRRHRRRPGRTGAEFEKANLGDDRVLENRAKTLAMFDAYVERYPSDRSRLSVSRLNSPHRS